MEFWLKEIGPLKKDVNTRMTRIETDRAFVDMATYFLDLSTL
ncbi:unnamed protein product [marine sediment metagenome]|uniref:Uncharacterized protein n=1 Tax=marine sediment metagenome TaxID=412755 RepID=X0YCZ8_9ZZZZ